jgi:hypothetical protein
MHQHHFRKRTQLRELRERFIVLTQRGCSVRLRLVSGSWHRDKMPRYTLLAVAAKYRQTGNNVVAGLHVVHITADLLDNAGTLMAQHHWHLARVTAIPKMHITVTDPAAIVRISTSLGPGLATADFFDFHRHVYFTKYCCFHHTLPMIWPDAGSLQLECATDLCVRIDNNRAF